LSIISKRRSEFCAAYLQQKQVVFARLEREVFEQSQREGDIIKCHRGCSYCCCVYVEATLKECEAIVYYLYQNRKVLISFLKAYPGWMGKTAQLGQHCAQSLNLVRKPDPGEVAQRELLDSLLFYKLQNTPCPFLKEDSCSIHFARPFTCAAHFVTTNPLWCSPRDPRSPRVYKGSFAPEIADLSFYQGPLKEPGLTLMPVKVYEIMERDYAGLSQISPGSNNEDKAIQPG
jgi:hypothetical protein